MTLDAIFSIPFSLVIAVVFLFDNVTTSLTVEGARDRSAMRRLTTLVNRRS